MTFTHLLIKEIDKLTFKMKVNDAYGSTESVEVTKSEFFEYSDIQQAFDEVLERLFHDRSIDMDSINTRFIELLNRTGVPYDLNTSGYVSQSAETDLVFKLRLIEALNLNEPEQVMLESNLITKIEVAA